MKKSSNSRMLGTVLTVLFGSLPATGIAVLPLAAILMGFPGIFSIHSVDEFSATLLLILWGLAGLIGTAALWVVAFSKRSFWTVAGLVAGLIAIFPATLLAVSQFSLSRALLSSPTWESIANLGLLTVPAVAFGWLLFFATSRPKKR